MDQRELEYWARSCLGKRRFAFEHHVRIEASKRSRRQQIALSYYYCDYCCGFHLFRAAPKAKRAEAQRA